MSDKPFCPFAPNIGQQCRESSCMMWREFIVDLDPADGPTVTKWDCAIAVQGDLLAKT